jgi:hypothetical protein
MMAERHSDLAMQCAIQCAHGKEKRLPEVVSAWVQPLAHFFRSSVIAIGHPLADSDCAAAVFARGLTVFPGLGHTSIDRLPQ